MTATLAHCACSDVQAEVWAKPVTKLLKSHMLKLDRIRNELMTVPYERYLEEVDNMTRATVNAQKLFARLGCSSRGTGTWARFIKPARNCGSGSAS